MKYDGSNLEEVLDESRDFHMTMGDEGSRAVFTGKVHDFCVPGAELSDANFSAFNCTGGDFQCVGLYIARFVNSTFEGVCFSKASMRLSTFYNVAFLDCNFEKVDAGMTQFHDCRFYKCDFREANFENVFFDNCTFDNVSNIPFTPMACPDTGAFIGWKQAICFNNRQKRVIVKLLIPYDAKRSSALGRKCRCDKAIVLEIQDFDGNCLPDNTIAWSFHNNNFAYIAGQAVTPEEPFDENRFDECASGIHFFINREEAVRYMYF